VVSDQPKATPLHSPCCLFSFATASVSHCSQYGLAHLGGGRRLLRQLLFVGFAPRMAPPGRPASPAREPRRSASVTRYRLACGADFEHKGPPNPPRGGGTTG